MRVEIIIGIFLIVTMATVMAMGKGIKMVMGTKVTAMATGILVTETAIMVAISM